MKIAKTPALALISMLFLGLTALLPLAAKAQPLDPANVQIQSFPVGLGPYYLVFDGANIWVANAVNAVGKLRASDGMLLGVYQVGLFPQGVLFDGTSIWVATNGN